MGGIAALGKWKQGFQQLGKPQQADDPRFDKEFYRESRALVALWSKAQTAGPDELDGVITVEEVDKAFKLLRRGKAAGVDGAVNEILKYAGPEMTRSLWVLFNTLFEEEQVPQDWEDGDKHIVDNYLGIPCSVSWAS